MNILITNVYGNQNKGDQSLFESLLRIINTVDGVKSINAIATNPAANALCYPDVNWYSMPWQSKIRSRYLRIIVILLKFIPYVLFILIGASRFNRIGRAFYDADIVIACPGGYLEDSNWSYWAHLAQMLTALRYNKTLILAPQSIGPIKNKSGRFVLKFVLSHAKVVFCREKYSYKFCTTILQKNRSIDNLRLTTDMVFYAAGGLENYKKPGSLDSIGVTIVNWRFYGNENARGNYVREMRKFVECLLARGERIVILPQTNTDLEDSDIKLARIIFEGLDVIYIGQDRGLNEYYQNFGNFKYIVGSRLHSCLIAILCGIPAVAIAYLPKSVQIFADLKLSEFVCDINTVDAKQLLELTSKLEDIENRRKYITEARDNYVKLSISGELELLAEIGSAVR